MPERLATLVRSGGGAKGAFQVGAAAGRCGAITRLRNIVDVALRSLTDTTINEIMLNDVREFIRINRLVQQAEAGGVTLRDPQGDPYRYVPITVVQPQASLGDSLDFSQSVIATRIAAGEEAARTAAAAGTHG